MDFGLSRKQRELQLIARGFAREDILPHASEWDQRSIFPVETLRQAGALGFGGLCVRGDVGGAALTRLEASLIVEELAQGCTSIAAYISHHNKAAWALDTFGNDEQRRRWLPDLCAMASLASCCLMDAGGGSDGVALQMRAVRHHDQYVLQGTAALILGGGVSNLTLIMARTGEGPKGISCFIVDGEAPGVSFGVSEKMLGWRSLPICSLILEDCRIPVTNRIATEGQGIEIARRAADIGRLNIAACSLGGAQFCLDHTVNLINKREAGEGAWANVETAGSRIADHATSLTAARLLLHRAAAAVDEKEPDAPTHVAMAKRFATNTAFWLVDRCLGLHAGNGQMAELTIERVWRDLRTHQIVEGSNELMQQMISRHLLGN